MPPTLALTALLLWIAVTEAFWFSAGTMVVSLAAVVVMVVAGARNAKRSASLTRVSALEDDLDRALQKIQDQDRRIDECERDRRELRAEVDRMVSRELGLMRRLTRLEQTDE